MQSLSDDERRNILGEVLMDELKTIHEYVKEIPDLKKRISRLEEATNRSAQRLDVDEAILKAHELDIRTINRHLSIA